MTTANTTRKYVYVEWLDSMSVSGWLAPRDIEEACGNGALQCETLGFLVNENDHSVTVSASISLCDDGETINSASDPITIPWCAITNIREVTFG